MTIASEVTKIIQEYKTIKKEMQEKFQTSFELLFKEFFSENPKVKEVRWDQYTPFFADGDACIFGVHDFIAIANIGLSEEESNLEYITPELLEKYDLNKTQENAKEFFKLLRSIPDEIFENMFEDHVTVTATMNGFETIECEHD